MDEVIDFLRTGRSPAEDGALFESKSFTPTEFASLAKKHGLETVRVAGRPIGFGSEMDEVFVALIPSDRRREIFRTNERSKLVDLLRQLYEEPYLAAIGSHLFVVTRKVDARRN